MKKTTEAYSYVTNKNVSSTTHEDSAYFSAEKIGKVWRFQQTHKKYTNTPLYSLRHLANYLGVKDIKVKDESTRFGLNAFKVMGGIYAVAKYLAELLDKDVDNLSFEELQSAETRNALGDITFITATDGNHGRGLAWAARELGQEAAIYMPKGSQPSRLEAIQNEGAFAEITELNYDATVRMAARLAKENDWVMVQDTAWEGYEKIPLWIMQGYASIAHEIVQEMDKTDDPAPTHVFLQAGVGSFAAGIASYLKQHYQGQAPKIIVVEPDKAECYYRSFLNTHNEMEIVEGEMDTIMAGLACGEPSSIAFRLLSHYAAASYSCGDSIAALGMRILGNPLQGDPRIISGESGAVPLGLLYRLRTKERDKTCEAINLDQNARVLIISTEGDTDQQHYRNIVWNGCFPNECI
ncbi:diaminopropionate ammonia-lyase [Marinococcus halophilus]|uniref:PLP-dependent lyase/thiolase n=1 Tax=Marinococcus halophilus TaxID=1371 RepID=A0A510YAP3_MARHA|nr:diaminopropionate ammonia-lyase [Marinococcus halophilus]OZT79618.1 diaminopropionate ammonia-lyase [Marinococcus halophilus]GEK59447.1 PLP-dependent lyase/thiolase [Marinococcus halophilus]